MYSVACNVWCMGQINYVAYGMVMWRMGQINYVAYGYVAFGTVHTLQKQLILYFPNLLNFVACSSSCHVLVILLRHHFWRLY